MIKIRQPGLQRHRRDREVLFQTGLPGLKRLTRKRYIDLGNDRLPGSRDLRGRRCRDTDPFFSLSQTRRVQDPSRANTMRRTLTLC